MIRRMRAEMIHKKDDQGFTLIELLVVIIIIGILAAIAIPVFLNQRKKGWDAGVKSDLRNLATSEETYLTDNSIYTVTLSDLVTAGLKISEPDYTTTTTPYGYVIKNYDTTGTLGASAGAGGYCASAQSKSGNWFTYDSTKGGLQTTVGDASGC